MILGDLHFRTMYVIKAFFLFKISSHQPKPWWEEILEGARCPQAGLGTIVGQKEDIEKVTSQNDLVC